MMDIVIGKNTLESLTTGMYSDAKIIYREYIQNSVDAIDEAIRLKMLKPEECFIHIYIDKKNNSISFFDNGTGIKSNEAICKLIDIGNSSKNHQVNRGFRGIGRLAGLSYCKNLTFETSYLGEDIKTVITFDAYKLSQILIPGKYEDHDLISVIKEITNVERMPEKKELHYFKVFLEEVDNVDNIMDYDIVKEYLCQIAPLPYNLKEFHWGKEIKEKLNLLNIDLQEYNIFLEDNNKKSKLYKIFRSNFFSGLRRKLPDRIKDIEIRLIKDEKGNIMAVIWYAISNFYGTICDNNIKGLRFRKGNIQIGDRLTLNEFFLEERFNGWFQGEIFVLDPNLIPNARRDNFEKNESYFILKNELDKIGNNLSKMVRDVSKNRSNIMYIDEELISYITNKLNSKEYKKKLSKEIDLYKEQLYSYDMSDKNFEKLQLLFDELKNITNETKYTADYEINLRNFNNNEKEVLNKVIKIIKENFPIKEANKIINTVILNFKKNK